MLSNVAKFLEKSGLSEESQRKCWERWRHTELFELGTIDMQLVAVLRPPRESAGNFWPFAILPICIQGSDDSNPLSSVSIDSNMIIVPINGHDSYSSQSEVKMWHDYRFPFNTS